MVIASLIKDVEAKHLGIHNTPKHTKKSLNATLYQTRSIDLKTKITLDVIKNLVCQAYFLLGLASNKITLSGGRDVTRMLQWSSWVLRRQAG